jgi:geranylgeranyl reductase family protein
MRAIVVGAGPGGASAALALATAGAAVDLVEKSAWPRAKTCGDGVSPLAVRELRALGAAFTPGLELRQAHVSTPGGAAFRGAWPNATPWGTIVERSAFDAALVDASIRAGAIFSAGTHVRAIASSGDGVAVTVTAGGVERELRADVAIVADGANGSLAKQLGFPPYRSRVVAVRAYARARRQLVAEYGLFYDRFVSPGYGWIFPLDEGRANVGVCVDERTLARAGGNLRTLLHRWLRENPRAREFFDSDVHLEDERGGLIPSGRACRSIGRVFLVGDAAGVADPFTAEGIYEAIKSGVLVARALAESPGIDDARARYENALRTLDCNEHVARALRATFPFAIGPYARYASSHPTFADRLMTDVFFAKPNWLKFMWGLHFGH